MARKRKPKTIIKLDPQDMAQLLLKSLFLIDDINAKVDELRKITSEVGIVKTDNARDIWAIYSDLNKIYNNDSIRVSQVMSKLIEEDKDFAFRFIHWDNYKKSEMSLCRMKALNHIMLYPDQVFSELIEQYSNGNIRHKFSYREIEQIHNNIGEYLHTKVNNTMNGLFKYCMTFPEHVTKEDKKNLVKRIMGRKKVKWAEYLLKESSIEFDNNLKDQLESLLVAATLKGE